MCSKGPPASILAQFASSSGRCNTAQSAMRRRATDDRIAGEHLPRKQEARLLTLVLRMEMGHAMLLIEHPHHDPEECRNYWHASVYRDTPVVGLTPR